MDNLEKELHRLIWGLRRLVGLTVFQSSFVFFVTCDIILVRQTCLFKAVILPFTTSFVFANFRVLSERRRAVGNSNSISQKE